MFIDALLLFPYYLTLRLRNLLYDKGIKKSYSYDVPIISVGNITVGGTGKTPHSEMLIRLFKDDYRIALISRGYKRKTKGYREVSIDDNYQDVGDEPLQVKRKFPEVTVAVDTSRKRAIEKLLSLPPESRPTLFILDDAFQHRQIKPLISIVLVDYSKPIFQDHLIPIGHLRDIPSEIKRADMVIVTKVPDFVEDNFREEWRKKLRLSDSQLLFFSKLSYRTPLPVSPENADNRYLYSKNAILFTGIADDTLLKRYMICTYKLNEVLRFGDHHDFTPSDIKHIEAFSRKHPTAVVLTTEKDAQRVIGLQSLTSNLKAKLFYVPIESEIIPLILPEERVIFEEIKDRGIQQIKECAIFAPLKVANNQ